MARPLNTMRGLREKLWELSYRTHVNLRAATTDDQRKKILDEHSALMIEQVRIYNLNRVERSDDEDLQRLLKSKEGRAKVLKHLAAYMGDEIEGWTKDNEKARANGTRDESGAVPAEVHDPMEDGGKHGH